jgi:A/G-specific adenine glycosylase
MKKASDEAWFTQKLLTWHFIENTRSMPWKGEKDPYKIWLSEVILQQTRVEQGTAYYLKFIAHFPTVAALATAPDNDVFKLWEGLGYYSRCRNLLATARQIVEQYGSNFPNQYSSILSLKGIGPYTAAAIASFAFELPYAVVDGNVNRILSRFFGIRTPIDSTGGKLLFAQLAQQLLPPTQAASYNQAIMDFGATICKPKLPLCDACCFQPRCAAYQNNDVELLPIKEKKIAKRSRWFYYVVAEKKGKRLIRRRHAKDIWQQLHEFVLIETDEPVDPISILKTTEFQQMFLGKTQLLSVSNNFRQQLTHQTIHAVFIHIKANEVAGSDHFFWVNPKGIKQLAFPKIISQYLQKESEALV